MEPTTLEQGADYPNLARILATARRWWWGLVLGMLIGAGIGLLGIATSGGATYESQTNLLAGSTDNQLSVLRAAGQQAELFATLATGTSVLDQARRATGDARSITALRADVEAKADDVTRLVTITARADSPQQAADVANAVATALRASARSVAASSALTVVEPADVPSAAVGGAGRPLIAIAALAGLLASLTVLVIFDLSRRIVASEQELAEASPAAVLGTAGEHEDSLLSAAAALGARHDRIAVAGVEDDGSGASAALALARALAAGGGASVIIVDADPGSHSLTRSLRLTKRPGLAEALARPVDVRTARELLSLTVDHGHDLIVLPRGQGELDPAKAAKLMRRLSRLADAVVICAPAATGYPGAVGWTRHADGALIAVRPGRVSRDRVGAAVQLLDRFYATVLGTVIAEPLTRGARRASRRRASAAAPAAPPTPSPA